MFKKKLIRLLWVGVASLSIFTLHASADDQGDQAFRGPISIKNKVFVDGKGNRFMIRGVAVADSVLPIGQPDDDHVRDMLVDSQFTDFSQLFLPKLKALHVNAIRVYVVDPTQSHDLAMKALQQAGIYVIAELASSKFGENVNRTDPTYPLSLYQRYTAVIDALAKYPNVLAFSVGNEVVFPGVIVSNIASSCQGGRDKNSTCIGLANGAIQKDAAILKSLTRDMKAYMQKRNYRAIPVGISMQDAPLVQNDYPQLTNTATVANYYACGPVASRMDFIGINAYRYTKQTDPINVTPQYVGLLNDYKVDALPVPFYLSETGGGVDPQAGKVRDWAIISKTYGVAGTKEYPDAKSIMDRYINDISGEVAFMLSNWKESAGLYKMRDTEPSAPYGGADNLATQFLIGINKEREGYLPIPPAARPFACPVEFNPPLVDSPVSGEKITVTIQNNFGDNAKPRDGIVVQSGTVIKPFSPSQRNVEVTLLKNQDVLIQTPPNQYYSICSVSKNILKDGDTIGSPQAPWGDTVACKVNGK